MIVVDTSSWIEWLTDSPAGRQVETLLPSDNEWIVPTVVQLELIKWSTRELGTESSDRVFAYSSQCRVVPLDTWIAVTAAEVWNTHKLARRMRLSMLPHWPSTRSV